MQRVKKIAQCLILYAGISQGAYAASIDKIVAVVNDNVITSQELDAQLVIQQRQLRQQRLAEPSIKVLKQQVLNHMIDTEAQLQLAEMHNIEASDAEVTNAIKTIAQKNKVTVSEIKNSIINTGETWGNYRKNIRKEIILSSLQQKSIGRISINDEQVNDYLKANKRNKQSRSLQYHIKDMLLPLPDSPSSEQLVQVTKQAEEVIVKLKLGLEFVSSEIELSDSKITVRGADLGVRPLAALPTMFSDKVVNMHQGDIVGPIRASNGLHVIKLVEIKGSAPMQMVGVSHVRHILLKSNTNTTSELQKKKLEELALQVKQGQSFESLAKKYSDDIGSAKRGGDLGWLQKGETVAEFEKAFESLNPGQISQPIKSTFGWHLIKLIGRKQIDNSKSIEKQQIRQALYQQKFSEAVETWLQHVRANAYIKTYI